MTNQRTFQGVKYDSLPLPTDAAARQAVKQKSREERRLPLWCKTLLAVSAILTLAALLYTSVHSSSSAVSQNENNNFLAIPLHPKLHQHRAPRTLNFNWTVTSGLRAPDGVEKEIYLVNGHFPGPLIEARSGDRIVVHVQNDLADEGLSLHWHGLRLKGNNSMDGAVGFTQCPIPPGREFTYDFTIGDDEHGTFWWHSHVNVQRGDGLYGGLVIHPPLTDHSVKSSEDEDQYLLLMGDWFHRKQQDVLEWFASSSSFGNEPVPDSMVINGRGRYNCSMAVQARPIVCNQSKLADWVPLLPQRIRDARLRIVNVGTVAGLSVAIDGATLQALEVDGGSFVAGNATDALGILYPGERVDVRLTWKESHGKQPWINVYLDDENFAGLPNPALVPEQAFPMLPESLEADMVPEVVPLESINTQTDLNTLTSPNSLHQSLVHTHPRDTLVFYVKTQILAHLSNRPVGSINQTVWEAQYPPLLAQNRSAWNDKQLVPFVATTNTSAPAFVDIVINNLDDGAHPFHLHGNALYVLSTYRADDQGGWGSYNPQEDTNGPPNGLNLKNPPLKDTVSVPRRGHAVLRVVADNPGLWMLHCHMLVHQGTGMVAGLHIGDAEDEEHVFRSDREASNLCPT